MYNCDAYSVKMTIWTVELIRKMTFLINDKLQHGHQ